MDRKVTVALITTASVLSLTALYFYSLSIGPATLPIGDLNQDLVGGWVETVGQVREVRPTSGGLSIILRDPLDFSEVAVFVPQSVYEGLQNKEGIIPGAEVVVRGELQLYGGELEILITSAQDLAIVSEAEP